MTLDGANVMSGNHTGVGVRFRGGSRTAAISKMEFVSFQPLTIITKCSILDVVAVLDPALRFMEVEECSTLLTVRCIYYLLALVYADTSDGLVFVE